VQYGEPIPPQCDGKEVYILDFTYSRTELLALKGRVRKLLVLDHHVTAQTELEGLDFARFDLSRSAATLTWEYFFPDKSCPWLLEYIEDRDLWAWKLPDSEAISAGLQSYRRDFDLWSKLIDQGPEALAREGRPILRYRKRLVEAAATRARMIELAGYRVPCVTSCLLQSEIGSRLAKKHPFVAIVFEVEGRRVWSLRSHSKGGIDVGELARQRGGGGHPHAASFSEPLETIAPGRDRPKPASQSDDEALDRSSQR
jgi:oligoribonuclease NrnB/cAMP/cGMP phosphodiesterase (DHH superfamily)